MEEAAAAALGWWVFLGWFFGNISSGTSQDVQEDQVDEEDELYTQVKGIFCSCRLVSHGKIP